MCQFKWRDLGLLLGLCSRCKHTPEVDNLMAVTKKALYLGIEQAQVGNRTGDIGHAIQAYVEAQRVQRRTRFY